MDILSLSGRVLFSSQKQTVREALEEAKRSGANLYGANLYGAALYGADLYGADLYGANLYGANLYGATGLEKQLAQFSIVAEGQLVVWKKLRNGLAKLAIPANAERVNSVGSRKCRASMAFVLELANGRTSDVDKHTGKLFYNVGEFVIPDSYDPSPLVECSHGIHFFITKYEAEEY